MTIIAINGSPRKNWNTHILLQKALDGAVIYTMNVQEAMMTNIGYTARLEGYKSLLERVLLSPSRSLVVTETLQTEDYSKYHMSMFDEAQRRSRRQEIFPVDCDKAYALGAAMIAR